MISEALLPTEKDIEFFNKNGYWTSKKVISDEQLEKLRLHMDKIHNHEYETGITPWSTNWKPGGKPSTFRKTDYPSWSDKAMRELAWNETIGAIASKLLQLQPIRLWHDQMLYKPGGGDPIAVAGWHQDYGYWQCADKPNFLTVWVAFDDVNEENGCVQVIPGSHKWGLMNESDFFNPNRDEQVKKMKLPPGAKWEIKHCAIKAGEFSCHHSMTIHGSGPNKTNKPRRSLVIHLMGGDIRYKAGTPGEVHMNVILLKATGGKAGDIFNSDLFPVIYPPEKRTKSFVDPSPYRPKS